MEYNMGWFTSASAAPYFLATDLNDVMLNGVMEAPLLSDPPRSVSLMAATTGVAPPSTTGASVVSAAVATGGPVAALVDTSHVPAAGDLSATIPAHEFPDWAYQDYTDYDHELKQEEIDFDNEEDIGPGFDDRRKSQSNSKKPKVHLDPKLKLKGPITYEKDVDPSVIPIAAEGMARCEKCGAIGVRHAFYTRERRFCSLRCARSVEAAAAAAVDGCDGGPDIDGASVDPHTPPDGGDALMDAASSSSPAMLGGDHLPQVGSSPRSQLEDGEDPSTSQSDELALPRRPVLHTFNWNTTMRSDPTFQATPVSSFPHAPLARCWYNVCVGMKVEVPNHSHGGSDPSSYTSGQDLPVFWVATVLRIEGYRGLVRYEGFGTDGSCDFWVDLCSDEVHPVGWCALQGRPLIPPLSISRKYADWNQFLVKRLTGARTLPSNFHHKVLRALGSQLHEGQVVEVADKSCMAQVRAASISQVIGRRLHIRYLDAPPDDGGFWCHENSPLVHPVGWAMSVGHRISAPEDYMMRCESGNYHPSYVTQDCLPAPQPVTHEGFKVGMLLEALDPLNLSSVGVATVRAVLGSHYLMVRLETHPPPPPRPPAAPSADPPPHAIFEGDDWFCYHASSHYIFPPGFAQSSELPLQTPHGVPADQFSWDSYLQQRQLQAQQSPLHAVAGEIQLAPAHLFHRPPLEHGFKAGHRLEAVDLMDPQLVCVATVAQVVGRLVRVHFDGWDVQFDQWVDAAASPDVFPVGWCRLVGYKLEPPRTPDSSARAAAGLSAALLAGKRAAGGRRRGGRRGRPAKSARLSAPSLTALPTATVVSCSPGQTGLQFTSSLDGSSLVAVGEDGQLLDPHHHHPDSAEGLQLAAGAGLSPEDVLEGIGEAHMSDDVVDADVGDDTTSFGSLMAAVPPAVTDTSSAPTPSADPSSTGCSVAVKQDPDRPLVIPCLSESSSSTSGSADQLCPQVWSVEDVGVFLTRNECAAYCDSFAQAQIDGARLLALSKDQVLELAGWKVGPSLKIENLVQKLRARVAPAQARFRASFAKV